MWFRKSLIRIRREYNTNPRRLFLYSGLGVLLGTIGAVLLDLLLPFEGWFGNPIRSVYLIPYSACIFVLGYAVSLILHYSRVNSGTDWVPYRLRLSVSWRRRISLVIFAIMFVAVYAIGFRVGYTVISSIFVAIAIALFAYMRATKEEASREELNIPDVRDTRYEREMQKRQEARLEATRLREEKKRERREAFLGTSSTKDEE